MKDTNKLIKNVLRALPAIPFIAPKKTSAVLPFIRGAIGVAVVGGIAAVMAFSPRTRYRALDVAKGGYGKVRGQLSHLVSKHDNTPSYTTQGSQGSNYSATGI